MYAASAFFRDRSQPATTTTSTAPPAQGGPDAPLISRASPRAPPASQQGSAPAWSGHTRFPASRAYLWDRTLQAPLLYAQPQAHVPSIDVGPEVLQAATAVLQAQPHLQHGMSGTPSHEAQLCLVGVVSPGQQCRMHLLPGRAAQSTGPNEVSVPCSVLAHAHAPFDSAADTWASQDAACTQPAPMDLPALRASLAAMLNTRGAAHLGLLYAAACRIAVRADGSAAISGSLLLPGSPLSFGRLATKRVVENTLARQLLGPAPHAAAGPAGSGPGQDGFLTMDAARSLVPLAATDPQVYSVPLVGVWMHGVPGPQHPLVLAACLRFAYSSTLPDKATQGPGAFLLLLYPPGGCHAPECYEVRVHDEQGRLALLHCRLQGELLQLQRQQYASAGAAAGLARGQQVGAAVRLHVQLDDDPNHALCLLSPQPHASRPATASHDYGVPMAGGAASGGGVGVDASTARGGHVALSSQQLSSLLGASTPALASTQGSPGGNLLLGAAQAGPRWAGAASARSGATPAAAGSSVAPTSQPGARDEGSTARGSYTAAGSSRQAGGAPAVGAYQQHAWMHSLASTPAWQASLQQLDAAALQEATAHLSGQAQGLGLHGQGSQQSAATRPVSAASVPATQAAMGGVATRAPAASNTRHQQDQHQAGDHSEGGAALPPQDSPPPVPRQLAPPTPITPGAALAQPHPQQPQQQRPGAAQWDMSTANARHAELPSRQSLDMWLQRQQQQLQQQGQQQQPGQHDGRLVAGSTVHSEQQAALPPAAQPRPSELVSCAALMRASVASVEMVLEPVRSSVASVDVVPEPLRSDSPTHLPSADAAGHASGPAPFRYALPSLTSSLSLKPLYNPLLHASRSQPLSHRQLNSSMGDAALQQQQQPNQHTSQRSGATPGATMPFNPYSSTVGSFHNQQPQPQGQVASTPYLPRTMPAPGLPPYGAPHANQPAYQPVGPGHTGPTQSAGQQHPAYAGPHAAAAAAPYMQHVPPMPPQPHASAAWQAPHSQSAQPPPQLQQQVPHISQPTPVLGQVPGSSHYTGPGPTPAQRPVFQAAHQQQQQLPPVGQGGAAAAGPGLAPPTDARALQQQVLLLQQQVQLLQQQLQLLSGKPAQQAPAENAGRPPPQAPLHQQQQVQQQQPFQASSRCSSVVDPTTSAAQAAPQASHASGMAPALQPAPDPQHQQQMQPQGTLAGSMHAEEGHERMHGREEVPHQPLLVQQPSSNESSPETGVDGGMKTGGWPLVGPALDHNSDGLQPADGEDAAAAQRSRGTAITYGAGADEGLQGGQQGDGGQSRRDAGAAAGAGVAAPASVHSVHSTYSQRRAMDASRRELFGSDCSSYSGSSSAASTPRDAPLPALDLQSALRRSSGTEHGRADGTAAPAFSCDPPANMSGTGLAAAAGAGSGAGSKAGASGGSHGGEGVGPGSRPSSVAYTFTASASIISSPRSDVSMFRHQAPQHLPPAACAAAAGAAQQQPQQQQPQQPPGALLQGSPTRQLQHPLARDSGPVGQPLRASLPQHPLLSPQLLASQEAGATLQSWATAAPQAPAAQSHSCMAAVAGEVAGGVTGRSGVSMSGSSNRLAAGNTSGSGHVPIGPAPGQAAAVLSPASPAAAPSPAPAAATSSGHQAMPTAKLAMPSLGFNDVVRTRQVLLEEDEEDSDGSDSELEEQLMRKYGLRL